MTMKKLMGVLGIFLLTAQWSQASPVHRKTPLRIVSQKAYRVLGHKHRVELLKAYQDFFTSYEKANSSLYASAEERVKARRALEKIQELFSLIQTAQADDDFSDLSADSAGEDPDFDCFYAGWPSQTRTVQVDGVEKKLCQTPAKGNPDYAAEAKSCGAGQLACQPALFGDGLCVSVATQPQRDSAFRSCARKFKASSGSLDKLADQIANDQTGRLGNLFEQLQSVTNLICSEDSNAFQKQNAMCKSLLKRVDSTTRILDELSASAQSDSGIDPQANHPRTLSWPVDPQANHPRTDAASSAPAASAERTSQIDVAGAIGCYHAIDQIFAPTAGYPRNMLVVPGLIARRSGALVFSTDAQSKQEKALFCQGETPDAQGFFRSFISDQATVPQDGQEKLKKCVDSLSPSSKYFLSNFIAYQMRQLTSMTARPGLTIPDDQLKMLWKQQNASRDPSAAELASFRTDVENYIKTQMVPAERSQEALQVCSKVKGDSRFSSVADAQLKKVSGVAPAAASSASPVSVQSESAPAN